MSTRLVTLTLLLALTACGGGTMDMRSTIDPALREDLETLEHARIFFGHHSVGADVLLGVWVISSEAGLVVQVDGAPIGRNEFPLEKIADFEKEALANEASVVAMKLCFVDVNPHTDVERILGAYHQAVARIRAARPGIVVVHVTPPLDVRQTNLVSRVKRLLGKDTWGDLSNERRLELAERMRAAFPNEPFFDLQALESTRADGTREMHVVGTRQVPMLWPGWARDSGHLNDAGKRAAGAAFVRTFAAAVRRLPR